MNNYVLQIKQKIENARKLEMLPTYDELLKYGFAGIRIRYPKSYTLVAEKYFFDVLVNACGINRVQANKILKHENEHLQKIKNVGMRQSARFGIFVTRENTEISYVPAVITLKPLENEIAKYILEVNQKSEGDSKQLKNLE
jgi:hypothetical protein